MMSEIQFPLSRWHGRRAHCGFCGYVSETDGTWWEYGNDLLCPDCATELDEIRRADAEDHDPRELRFDY